jgi:hypothetical protein
VRREKGAVDVDGGVESWQAPFDFFSVSGRSQTVKYVLLFCGDADDAAAFQALSPEELGERYAQVGRWFQEHQAKILHSDQLQPPTTATTVRHAWTGGEPVITDGPFIEAKEQIGGYAAIDVEDLDEALRMARTWPGRGAVEIRPVMVMR